MSNPGQLHYVKAVAKNEVRIMARNPVPLAMFTLAPILLISFIAPAVRPALILDGHIEATGAEQAVPGMAVMFAFLYVGIVGFGFFREYGWGTWYRLRVSAAESLSIMLGKALPSFCVGALQLLILYLVGIWVFDLETQGPALALIPVGLALVLCLVSLGIALFAVCRTVQQLNAIGFLGGMLMAGVSGALTPANTTPGWTHPVRVVTPPYWAMQGFDAVILDGRGWSGVAGPTVALLTFSLLFVGVAVIRLRFADRKVALA